MDTINISIFVETRKFYVGDRGPAVAIRYPSWPGAEKQERNTTYVPTLGLDGLSE